MLIMAGDFSLTTSHLKQVFHNTMKQSAPYAQFTRHESSVCVAMLVDLTVNFLEIPTFPRVCIALALADTAY